LTLSSGHFFRLSHFGGHKGVDSVVAPAEIKHLNKLSATPDSASYGGWILRVILGFHKSGADGGVEIAKKHTPKAESLDVYTG